MEINLHFFMENSSVLFTFFIPKPKTFLLLWYDGVSFQGPARQSQFTSNSKSTKKILFLILFLFYVAVCER